MADRDRTNRKSLLGVGLALLTTAMILLPGASMTSAQSTGGIGGAILELVPNRTKRSDSATFPLLNAIPDGANGSTFYVEGVVYLNRTVRADCSINPDTDEDVVLQDDGRRVGVWRIWGVRTGATSTTQTTGGITGSPNSLTGGKVYAVNMAVDLEGYNGTLQFQGTLGRVFGAIESAGHPPSDILAITGGTGTFRSASGDGVLTPLVVGGGISGATPCPAGTNGAGGFQLFLKEGNKLPRFSNLIPAP